MRKPLIFSFIFLTTCFSVSAKLFDCPVNWVQFNGFCYRFVAYPRENYDRANAICREDGATLLSVNSAEEHRFLINWLEINDQRRDKWYTSGVVSTSVTGGVAWQGDNSFSQTLNYWINATDATLDGNRLVYKHSGIEYGWGNEPQNTISSFICEISQTEAYRILEENRGFDYGVDILDPNLIPRGPKFIIEPEETVILGKTTMVWLECVAEGMPNPKYTWHRIRGRNEISKLTADIDPRYTLTNGRLTISNPTTADESDYQCLAENSQGKTLSDRVQLSFGYLMEFINTNQDDVIGYKDNGVQMKCPDINFKPARRYQWYKNSIRTFVRPELQDHIFISNNGKLYFSEVTTADAGMYYCLVTITNEDGSTGGNYLGASQSPRRASLGFRLIVRNEGAGRYQPQIVDDFISVFPGNPQRGQTLMMECFAYGTGDLIYQWSRVGNELPKGVSFRDHGRLLVIPDVAPEDEGIYNCRVESTKTGGIDSKNYTLRIEARPYFTFPLKDQHTDVGARLTWHCEASASPAPTYIWYKNGEVIKNQTGSLTVYRTTLRIESLKKTDSGMYQCAASNKHGNTYTTAQLRVIEFPPSFKKYPLERFVSAAIGGNITYVCNPEAAPAPTYTWKKDRGDLGLTQGSVSGNKRILMNGNLYIEGVTRSDQGEYTCAVENFLGKAENSGYMSVVEKTVMSRVPKPVRVTINSTATMICEGSHNPNMDMVYTWYFNGYRIKFEDSPHYRLGGDLTSGYLYILNAQFIHAGTYKCEVATSLDQSTGSADLTVLGPPGMPVGVFEDASPPVALGKRQIRLLWTDGLKHGADILHYIIEFKTNFDMTWRVLVKRLYVSEAVSQTGATTKKSTILSDLKPGAKYYFRVRATNRYGNGEPSNPTTAIAIDSDKPKKAPDNVGGGGGKVGDLTITWDPLPEEDLNGNGLGYKVMWRRKPEGQSNTKWENAEIKGRSRDHYVTTVGGNVYYLDYEVQVQAFNELGLGNISDIVTIKSAEDLPFGTPTNVYSDSYNSTALIVFWDPVPDNRQNMKGKLQGYKINYWRKDEDEEEGAPQNILSGQRDQGLIIGLEPDTWYTVNVQVFNGAGNGPKSEVFHQSTDRAAPQLYPTEIYVHSHGSDSVRVDFRGVSTQNFEEPLQGYKIKFWRMGEDIRKALHYDCEKSNYGIISGVEPNVVYQLRVFGYSQGGQGKMSSPATYFTLGGLVRLDPSSTEILAGSSSLSPYCMVVLLSSLIALFYHRL